MKGENKNAQGFCVARIENKTYYICSQIKDDTSNTVITIFNSKKKKVSIIKDYCFGHINSITYGDGYIWVLKDNDILKISEDWVLNAIGKTITKNYTSKYIVQTIESSKNYRYISYDRSHHILYAAEYYNRINSKDQQVNEYSGFKLYKVLEYNKSQNIFVDANLNKCIINYKVDADKFGSPAGLKIYHGLVFIGRDYHSDLVKFNDSGIEYKQVIDILQLNKTTVKDEEEYSYYKVGFYGLNNTKSVFYELEDIDLVFGNNNNNYLVLYENRVGKSNNKYNSDRLYYISLNNISLTQIAIKVNNKIPDKGEVTGIIKDSEGNVVAKTTTNESGNVNFKGLNEGTYTLILKSNSKNFKSIEDTYTIEVEKRTIKKIFGINDKNVTIQKYSI